MNDLFSGSDNLPVDQNKDYLADLVGDGKKFKTVQDLAKGKYEADLYIQDIVRQKDELYDDYKKIREESVTRAKLEDLLDRLERSSKVSSDEPTANKNTETQPSFDLNKVESLVSSKIEEFETRKKQDTNYNIVKNKLVEKFGENYQASLKRQIDALGLTVEDVNQLARTKPQALSRMLDLDNTSPSDTFQAPPRHTSRINDPFAPSSRKERTWSYYQELKKSDPKAYWDPKTQVQMHEDHTRLEGKFEDGDFHKFD